MHEEDDFRIDGGEQRVTMVVAVKLLGAHGSGDGVWVRGEMGG